MKKFLAVLMVLMLAVTAFTVAVSAEPSPQGALIGENATGVDTTGKNVQVRVVKSPKKSVTDFEAEFNKIKEKDSSMNMLSHVDIIADGDTSLLTFPLTLTIPIAGATASTKGYFLLKKPDGTIVRIDAVMGDGNAVATFPSLGEVVFVSDMNVKSEIEIGTPEQSSGGKTSDKTSDAMASVIVVLMLGVLAVGVSSKKLLAK